MSEVWEPQFSDEDGNPHRGDPVQAVFQAIGAATNPEIWGPDGVFQEQKAIAIAEGLIDYLRKNPL